MPASILVIQFRLNQAHSALEQASIDRELAGTVTTTYQSALDEVLFTREPAALLASYDGLILGGSGDFDFDGGRAAEDAAKVRSYELLERLRPLLAYVFATDFPLLGICFGHQLVGAYAGATVCHDPVQRKSRSHPVSVVTGGDDGVVLLAGVPPSFYAHYGHKDSLDRVPEGATLLVQGGEACRVSALQYQQNIYTTQFHPELNVADMHKRLALLPGYLPEGVSVEEVFSEDSYSNTILRNFGSLVTATRQHRLRLEKSA